MKKHEQKIKELIKAYSKTLQADCDKLLKSGMIDVEKFSPDEYALAKIIITAAIARTADGYRPLHNDHRKEIKNLICT